MGLSRAQWELYRNRPEADPERLNALGDLAATVANAGDLAAGRRMFEELVAVERRTKGDGHPDTQQDIERLGNMLTSMGEYTEALPLLEEALAGLRLMGLAIGENDYTLTAVTGLARVYGKLNSKAKSRLLYEEAVAAMRRTRPTDARTFETIASLGESIYNVGDLIEGLALIEEASASALHGLGPQHPKTQELADVFAHFQQAMTGRIPGTRAIGTLVGLASKPELNGKQAAVVGFDTGKERYHVCHAGMSHTSKPIGIKPANFILAPGSAVIVEGLDAAAEWNGKRGLVKGHDAAKGRYRLSVEGRAKALGVRLACCKLVFAVGQEQQEQHGQQEQ